MTIVGVLVWALLKMFVFYEVPSGHPSPVSVVSRYLADLERGDASAAARLDGTARAEGAFVHVDQTSFLADAVLGAASERIEAPRATLAFAGRSNAAVDVEFRFDGKEWHDRFGLSWNAKAGQWVIDSTLAGIFHVFSTSPSDVGTVSTNVSFSFGGTRPSALEGSAADNTGGYAAYPGIYPLVVALDPSTVVDATATPLAQKARILPFYRDAVATFFAIPVRAG
ncbi:MAG: hypothetical protein ABI400_04970 [Lacisediminihabitans sp.]